MPPESRSRDGNGDSREDTKARRGKARLGFVFFAASRTSEPVAHAKARRREGAKRESWGRLRVLRGFACDGTGRSREGTKARREKAGLGFVFFAASRATFCLIHTKARRRKVLVIVDNSFAALFES